MKSYERSAKTEALKNTFALNDTRRIKLALRERALILAPEVAA